MNAIIKLIHIVLLILMLTVIMSSCSEEPVNPQGSTLNTEGDGDDDQDPIIQD